MVDEINYTDEELSAICEKIYSTSKAIFNASSNVSVRVYGLNSKNKQTGCDFYGRTDNVNGLESILKKVSHTELSADDLVDISRATSISEAIDYVALSYIISNIDDDQFKDNFNGKMSFSEAVKKASELGIAFDHEEFGFIFFDADRTNCNVKGFDTLFSIGSNSYNIKQSIVSNVAGIENKDEYKYSYARVLFDETEGMNFDIAANREVFVEDVIKYIYGKVPTEAGAYDAIIATGYSTVVLDKPLTEHDMELAEKRFDDPEYVFSDEEVKSCADTDRDGLFDFEEVMFYSDCAEENKFIKFNNGNIELPQVADIMRIFEVNGIYAYVDSGVEEARKQYGDCWAIFLTEPVLPIISDPTSVDSDGDGRVDKDDIYPIAFNIFYDRNAVYKYAEKYHGDLLNMASSDGYNKSFYSLIRGDCANFLSQCINSGGYSMNSKWFMHRTGTTSEKWFSDNTEKLIRKIWSVVVKRQYKDGWTWTNTWTVAEDSYKYISTNYGEETITISSIEELEKVIRSQKVKVGDAMYMYSPISHATVITKITDDDILFTAHTSNKHEDGIRDMLDGNFCVTIVTIKEVIK